MSKIDYWKECINSAANECELILTPEQLDCLANGAEGGHEHYGMAFYSPWSVSMGDIERDAAYKLKRLQAEFDAYRKNAETAVRKALCQHDDAQVTIGERGEVLRHGGRTERIQ